MVGAKQKVDPGKRVEREKAVEDVAIAAVASDKQSQEPVDRTAIQPRGLEVEANAIPLADGSRPAHLVGPFC